MSKRRKLKSAFKSKSALTIKLFLIVFILSQTATPCFAQNTKEVKYYTNNNRHWLAEIPLWIPGLRGQIAYGEFDLSSSTDKEEKEHNLLNSDGELNFYFVGRIAVEFNKFWVQTDAFSGEVGSTYSYTSLNGNNEKDFVVVDIQGTIPRLVLGYSVWQKTNENSFKIKLTPYLGVRYVSFHLQSEVFDSTYVINEKLNWFEPVVGVYIPINIKRFKIEVQADYGSTGTYNSWAISNRYRYRISKLIDVQLGWNYIRSHHNDIVGSEEFKSTIRLFGPTTGIGFRF
jgi:hypothetical protein